MDQTETKYQKLIINALNFYTEIGIDITVSNRFSSQEHILFEDNKKNIKLNKNYNIQKNKDIKIKELEHSFENFDGCKL